MEKVWAVWEWNYESSDMVALFDSEEKAIEHIIKSLGGIKTKFCGKGDYSNGRYIKWTVRVFEVH